MYNDLLVSVSNPPEENTTEELERDVFELYGVVVNEFDDNISGLTGLLDTRDKFIAPVQAVKVCLRHPLREISPVRQEKHKLLAKMAEGLP